MLEKIAKYATFGNRELCAGVIYFVLGALVLGASFFESITYASITCGSGMRDCGGICIPESEECCPDGTHGNATTCCCCSAEGSSSLPTITCLNEGESL